jgi:hypothetical protein
MNNTVFSLLVKDAEAFEYRLRRVLRRLMPEFSRRHGPITGKVDVRAEVPAAVVFQPLHEAMGNISPEPDDNGNYTRTVPAAQYYREDAVGVIAVHPALARDRVPTYVLRYVLGHELAHHLLPMKPGDEPLIRRNSWR